MLVVDAAAGERLSCRDQPINNDTGIITAAAFSGQIQPSAYTNAASVPVQTSKVASTRVISKRCRMPVNQLDWRSQHRSRGSPRCRRLLFAQIFKEFLDPGKEAFAFGIGLGRLAGLFEFAQQFLLAFRQVDRRLDDSIDVHVAAHR